MEIVAQRGGNPAWGPTAVAMGYFDGVHKGHQAVIEAAARYAQKNGLSLAVFTFSQGKYNNKNKRLLSIEDKHRALEELGVKYCFEPPFESFFPLQPEEYFHEMLVGEYGAKALFCGHDFRFGAGRSGDAEMLRKMCDESGVYLELVGTAMYKGEPVSSTRIREELGAGHIEEVNAMMGRPYAISLPVVRGQQLGRTLGFPTLNQIYPEEMQAPGAGVYITSTVLNGTEWASATGYGDRPTVNGVGDTCETFVPGFSGDLYDQTIQVRFYKKIADMIKFDTKEELADAVLQWAVDAQEYFKNR